MITFRVFAGGMYCGFLAVWRDGSQTFLSRSDETTHADGIIERVASYKHLKLVRV